MFCKKYRLNTAALKTAQNRGFGTLSLTILKVNWSN